MTNRRISLPAGWAYALPTEAQWEYACRAGTTTAYSWGARYQCNPCQLQLGRRWRYGSCFSIKLEDVGQYPANSWGFFDMHGNVWNGQRTLMVPMHHVQTDPLNAGAAGSNRVIRGGSWYRTGTSLASAFRHLYDPSGRNVSIGFRLALRDMNKAPTDLNSTAVLYLPKTSQSAAIGEFNATDPDENSTITYHFKRGK